MPPLVPPRFLVRVAHPCKYIKAVPRSARGELLDLPPACRLDNFAAADGAANFADLRMAWNELGIAFQAEVSGKDQPPQGDIDRPRHSDGVTLWLDTRADRTAHRASRYCHQFHFLPVGGGPDKDEPAFIQTKIHRALQDAPLAAASAVPFRCQAVKGGYIIEAFLPVAVLSGFDPEEHPRLGVYYAVRDAERGEQTLAVGAEFPYAEDPSLWQVLDLSR
jgi:hypothetical protein